MEYKVCKTCGELLPNTSDVFQLTEGKYLSGSCKKCRSEKSKKYYNYEKDRERQQLNKEKIKEQHHIRYLENKEKVLQKSREQFLKNKEKCYERTRDWQKRNKEHLREYSQNRYQQTKEHQSAISKIYRQAHKEENRIRSHVHRAKEKQVEHSLTKQQWETIKEVFGNKCAYCGQEKKLTQEHFVPLYNRGEYSVNNIVPACMSCNCSKSTKSFFDWYPTFKHYDKEREQKILDFLGYDNGTQQLRLII